MKETRSLYKGIECLTSVGWIVVGYKYSTFNEIIKELNGEVTKSTLITSASISNPRLVDVYSDSVVECLISLNNNENLENNLFHYDILSIDNIDYTIEIDSLTKCVILVNRKNKNDIKDIKDVIDIKDENMTLSLKKEVHRKGNVKFEELYDKLESYGKFIRC